MPLAEYRRKRRFQVTPEPAGKARKAKASKQLSYVIQKHAATRLHYDLRLELDGVLKSWAVPKGPSFDPTEKRLAVEVEDHPLEYATFEGRIPEGQYGAGEVIVWDRGVWTPLGDPHQGLRSGNLKFELQGKKLEGSWVLVRIRNRERTDKPNWLLIKHRDEFSRPMTEYDVTTDQPRSVKTGRTIEELSQKQNRRVKAAVVKSNGKPRARRKRSRRPRAVPAGATKAPIPGEVDVQLATLEATVPEGREWLHEIKLDGYRLICRISPIAGTKPGPGASTRRQVALFTRRHQDWTHRYRSIAQAAAALPVDSAILDGELVALLPTGVSSFQALQNAGKPGDTHLVYFAFDLLYLDGYDLRRVPLIERKEQLREVLSEVRSPLIQYSDHLDGAGTDFLRESCNLGLEGIISKRRDRPYVSGRNSDWVKVKCLGREELVIGGFTLSTGDRRGIGALLVGYFEKDRLIYAGRVGTGFNSQTLLDMRQRLEKLRQDSCPFAAVPPKERGPSVKWVRPQLVAEIQFGAWTEGGILRQPSFQGLREDKAASEVRRPDSLKLTTGDEAMPATKKKRPTKAMTHARHNGKPSVGGLRMELTHPERVLYADMGLTKLGLANFYAQIAEWILPQLVDRPLSLLRCPEGQAAGKCFFQKHPGTSAPKSLGRVEIDEKDGPEEYVYVRDVQGLLALVQMSVLEIHPWGAKRDQVERPDRLTFDLDPGPDVPWARVIDAALEIRKLLDEYDLQSWVKTTGGKGLHVVVPVSPRRREWDEAKRFCKHVAGQLAEKWPSQYTINMSKALRKGKIFVDYLRNDRGATAVAAYSTRARAGAPVSTPLAWDELSPAIRSDHFNVENLPARLTSLQRDPWAQIDSIKQSLPRTP